MFGTAWSYNFKKIKVNEEKLYVYNIVFASFVNLNYVNTTKNSYKKYKKFCFITIYHRKTYIK